MMTLDEVIVKAKINMRDVVAVYPYGSRVYGTARKTSDYDYIVIADSRTMKQFSDNIININFYTPTEHQERLNDHEISALECYFISSDLVLYEKHKFKFELDKTKLRHSLSAKASNSWVKAMKKLTVEKDYDLDLGRKSLFHSLRIIDYGIQIAKEGRIVNYSSCNGLFNEIMRCYTWNEMFNEYKQKYNTMSSEFREVAPK